MTGSNNSNFSETLTPYLKQKLEETSEKYGINFQEYKTFEKQYLKSSKEDEINHDDRLRYYQSKEFL